jgi:DHA2 family multidrug resistance protein-like MFS transporter
MTFPSPVSPPGVASPAAGRREWLALAVLALPCLVYAMDLTVLNLALPAISADLQPTSSQLLWIVDIYGFMVAGALITMGALGDRIGGRRLLLIGAAAFAGASALAAIATTPLMLIGARALLGVAGATIAPSTLSLISALFRDPRQRTLAIGVWVASYSLGAAVGPLVGGVLLELFGWGSVFLIAIPVMGLLLVLGPRLLPERRAPAAGRLDPASAALAALAVLTAVYGIKQLATAGPGLAPPLWIGTGAALAVAFVRRQRRLPEPLIDLGLFRSPAFAAALGTNLAAFVVIFGMSVLLAQYLQSVLGLTPLTAGLWSVPEALGFIAGSLIAPRLIQAVPRAAVVAGGMGAGALGYVVIAQAGGLAPVVTGATIGAGGLAVVATLITDIAVGSAPPERAGAAAATSETSSELGGALGIAILGSIGAAVYRAGVPAGTPDTIGAAHASAAARDAFTQALTVTASISALVLLAGAVLGHRLLARASRHAPQDGLTRHEPAPAVQP